MYICEVCGYKFKSVKKTEICPKCGSTGALKYKKKSLFKIKSKLFLSKKGIFDR